MTTRKRKRKSCKYGRKSNGYCKKSNVLKVADFQCFEIGDDSDPRIWRKFANFDLSFESKMLLVVIFHKFKFTVWKVSTSRKVLLPLPNRKQLAGI